MAVSEARLKEPTNLSPRIQWLRDYYFKGVKRNWNNEYLCFTTGTDWDEVFDEVTFYVVPETYSFFRPFVVSARQSAHRIEPPEGYFTQSLVERRVWFIREAMVHHVPQELLPGDLLAGARFNILASRCWSKAEAAERNKRVLGKGGTRDRVKEYHDRGFGNCGATSAHLIPDYATVLKDGFKAVHEDIEKRYSALSEQDKKSPNGAGAQLRAMMTAALMPKDLAERYAALLGKMAEEEKDGARRIELLNMQKNLARVPWEGARDFWEAMQSLWFTHMLVMADENFPGAGLSFGRLDQILQPYWKISIQQGMDREFGKEILKCFWMHCNSAYDAMIRTGNNQGITAGYGQLFNIGGMGKNGIDMTCDMTWALLEVIDEMSPILEPKPNVRLHRGTPEKLLDRVVDMIAASQGAPFLLNFDERAMAGMLREAKRAHVESLINEDNVHDYASVGCMENTMVGCDRSGTVDCNVNLLKAVELSLNGGRDLIQYSDPLFGKKYKAGQEGPATGDPRAFKSFAQFYEAFEKQLKHVIHKTAELYNETDEVRARFAPTPFLSCLVRGCAERGRDVTGGGPQLRFVTVEGVTFATAVDSLLAVKYLVYDNKDCTMDELIKALRDNWQGHELLQAKVKNKAPKYGRDDDEADSMALRVMDLFSEETWKYRTKGSDAQYRAGMLSWNYWVSDGYILAASADGRKKGQFLSNAICPSNGADTLGPTANANSVGKVMGGRSEPGDYLDYRSNLPNGASHTITFSPAFLRDSDHRGKFKAFLRGYSENGGSALQINILDADMLRDAQKRPEEYRNLLVRVTGYNAYFTTVGRELQNEIIARESHSRF
jgi:formate C-acetyltransferase